MKSLPLFYYPSTVLWVDDDANFLTNMEFLYSRDFQIQTFRSARECIATIDAYTSPLKNIDFITINDGDENYGLLTSMPMDFDITQIVKLAQNPQRYDEIALTILDYSMPEMDGLSLAKKLSQLPCKNILLTGNAQEEIAINGFNKQLITAYLKKSAQDILEQIKEYVKKFSLQYFAELTLPLLKYLETDALLPQSDPDFAAFFIDYCQRNNVQEFYLIDKNGSYLCIDKDDNRSCFVVQTENQRDAWLDQQFNAGNIKHHDVTELMSKQKLAFFGVGKQDWQIPQEEWAEHYYDALVFKGRDNYLWCKVDLD